LLILVGIGVIVIIAAIVCLHSDREGDFVEYRPVVLRMVGGDPVLVDCPEMMNGNHVHAVINVLWKYGEDFRMEGHKLYIRRWLAENRDLLWNYTEKADSNSN
jgi:hypothetical protein